MKTEKNKKSKQIDTRNGKRRTNGTHKKKTASKRRSDQISNTQKKNKIVVFFVLKYRIEVFRSVFILLFHLLCYVPSIIARDAADAADAAAMCPMLVFDASVQLKYFLLIQFVFHFCCFWFSGFYHSFSIIVRNSV